MKLYFNHFWGSQERADLCITECTADFEKSEEKHALETGWLYHKGKWYQSRSTRINLNQYTCSRKHSTSITHEWISDIEPYRDRMREIYHHYLNSRNLKDSFDPFDDVTKNNIWLLVFCDSILCGFSKIMLHENGMESIISPWHSDYRKYSIGWYIIHMECEKAKSNNLDFIYIGPGYEKGSIYKSNINGFEWWTGNEWSKNKEQYKYYCENDSKVLTIYDLEKTKIMLDNS